MVDYMTGMTAAFGSDVRPARRARAASGATSRSVSTTSPSTSSSYPATWYLNEGLVTTRRAARPTPTLPSQLYRTQDGWIFFMCQTQRFWELLCAKIGRPDLIDEPMYRDQARATPTCTGSPKCWTSAVGQDHGRVVEVLGGAVPCAPVYDVRQALENPFLAERDGVQWSIIRIGRASS